MTATTPSTETPAALIRDRIVELRRVRAGDLAPHPENWRKHPDRQRAILQDVLAEVGYASALVARQQEDGTLQLIDGHLRADLDADATVPVLVVDVTEHEARKLLLSLDPLAAMAEAAEDRLRELVARTEPATEGAQALWDQLLASLPDDPRAEAPDARGSLVEQFGAPPFTILDARVGWWRKRRKQWDALGVDQIATREGLTYDPTSGAIARYSDINKMRRKIGRDISVAEYAKWHFDKGSNWATGTSAFDPVLVELVLRWWCPPAGTVLDPFAGGPTTGIVAAILGRRYVGVELRPEQVAHNRQEAERILRPGDPRPVWIEGDSRTAIAEHLEPGSVDLIFTSPPFFDLEEYSDDPRDLSHAGDYTDFLVLLEEIMSAATSRLAPDRFAVVHIGDTRDPRGYLRNLPADTASIMGAAGLRLYNDAVVLHPATTAFARAAQTFKTRKLVRMHEHVLVGDNGDPARLEAAHSRLLATINGDPRAAAAATDPAVAPSIEQLMDSE